MGVERIPNKSQHRKLTVEKKILLPRLPGFELATFQDHEPGSQPRSYPGSQPRSYPGSRADLTHPSTADLKAVRVPAKDASWGILFHNLMAEGRKEWTRASVVDWGRRRLFGCPLKRRSFVLGVHSVGLRSTRPFVILYMNTTWLLNLLS